MRSVKKKVRIAVETACYLGRLCYAEYFPVDRNGFSGAQIFLGDIARIDDLDMWFGCKSQPL